MNKFVAHLALFLLALFLLSSQVVQAKNDTDSTNSTVSANTTMTPMTTKGSGCGRTEAFTLLLLPLALATALIHDWS